MADSGSDNNQPLPGQLRKLAENLSAIARKTF